MIEVLKITIKEAHETWSVPPFNLVEQYMNKNM